MPLTKVTSSLINTVSASQIVATGATAGQVLTYNGSTSTWVASAAPTGGAGASGNVQAWVNFDGTRDTTGTVSTANTNRYIKASFNVSHVSRSRAGDYIINFSGALVDANYVPIFGCTGAGGDCLNVYSSDAGNFGAAVTKTSTQLRILATTGGGAIVDAEEAYIAVFR